LRDTERPLVPLAATPLTAASDPIGRPGHLKQSLNVRGVTTTWRPAPAMGDAIPPPARGRQARGSFARWCNQGASATERGSMALLRRPN